MGKPKAGVPNFDDLQAMFQASGLQQKLLFTIGMLAVFRLGAQIPVWGVNAAALQGQLGGNQLITMLDMFSGGALSAVSILALGIGPYITASIIMQLMTVVIPRLEELQKEEGEAGRRQISKYTRYLTVGLAMLQAALILKVVVQVPGAMTADTSMPLFYTGAVISLTAGSLFAMWLAEMITERGVGNGGSLLIFVGILSRLPYYAQQTADFVGTDGHRSLMLVILMAVYLLTIGLIIVLTQASRNIFIVSAKRQVGNRVYGGQNTHIPFKINPAGVMPIIFAFAILSFVGTLFSYIQHSNPTATGTLGNFIQFYSIYLLPGKALYIFIEFALIVFFTFFYASIVPSMQPKEIADNLKKYGNAIPGVKPGRPTADKLEEILTRTTFIGAVALAGITLLASAATSKTGITTLAGIGASSLIIMVGVALDTVNQIKVHMLARQYEGFLK